MKKLIKSLLLSFFAVLLFAGSSYAANSTSIRLEQPKAQTNNSTFNITFVALDTNSSQPVSVQCYKKGPSDGSFVSFGSVINLSNGGNTSNCSVNSGVINQGNGTYTFEAVVTQGSTTPTSNTVSVDYNDTTPGIPTGYNKEKIDSCTYKISFKSADDSGKTVRIELYRSADASFNADAGHKVNSVNIGSNTDGSMTDNISPNCSTSYYYAIRAFDAYGNGSGVTGDQNITTTNPTTTQQQGAIPVGSGGTGANGSSVGGANGGTGAVLGTESAKETPAVTKTEASQNPVANGINWIANHKKIDLLILVIVAGIAFYLYRRNRK